MLLDQLNHCIIPIHWLDHKTGGMHLFEFSKEVEKLMLQQFYENRIDKNKYKITNLPVNTHRTD